MPTDIIIIKSYELFSFAFFSPSFAETTTSSSNSSSRFFSFSSSSCLRWKFRNFSWNCRWKWNEAMYATTTAICVLVHHSFHFLFAPLSCTSVSFLCWCWQCWRWWDLMWMMMIPRSRRRFMWWKFLHSTNSNNEANTSLTFFFHVVCCCWRDSGEDGKKKSYEKLCTACSKHRKSWSRKKCLVKSEKSSTESQQARWSDVTMMRIARFASIRLIRIHEYVNMSWSWELLFHVFFSFVMLRKNFKQHFHLRRTLKL